MTAVLPVVCAALGVPLAGTLLWVRRRLVVVTVEGPSMEPALRDGDRVLVRRVPLPRVRAGQVMVARRPPPVGSGDAPGGWLIKRVVAVPGEPVPPEVRPAVGEAGDHDVRVPAGCLVVLGDNRARSADSRHWGYVTGEHLLGVVHRAMSARP
ncbi:S26 family signal peptidase [Planomonospora sp. ID82291]|uniref:S26 family signal peptidase n=1 Tax=Planomonospora sp. ID82291 TaxID=2738136 RepID=UPI0018C409CA|nr:S26 family signal peptidase [Planomonospora sp. ID82291]MBG0816724.1 S26 family signal peptidase [Planomonospora sp. ID82291]